MAADWNAQLFTAAKEGNVTAMRQALAAGAEIDARTANQTTPLMSALDRLSWEADSKSIVDSINVLLEAGAEVDAQTDRQVTTLHNAAWNGHIDAVKTLLAAGARPGAKRADGYTAIDCARMRGHPDLSAYMQSVVDDPSKRPTPQEVGLDMAKRNTALVAMGKKPMVCPQTAEPAKTTRAFREAETIRKNLREGKTDPSEVGF